MNDTPATLQDYRAAVSRLTGAMDRILAAGQAARRRDDELQRSARAYDVLITPLASRSAEGQQPFRALEAMTEHLYQQLSGPMKSDRTAQAAVAPRTLLSRHRI